MHSQQPKVPKLYDLVEPHPGSVPLPVEGAPSCAHYYLFTFLEFLIRFFTRFLVRFLTRFSARFLARVLARFGGRAKTINTVYSTTRTEKYSVHVYAVVLGREKNLLHRIIDTKNIQCLLVAVGKKNNKKQQQNRKSLFVLTCS